MLSCLDDPRASYRAENPTNPKIGQKYQPDIQIPLAAGDRKNTPKIPEKYPKNTNFVFFEYSRGYLKGYFGESHVLYAGGYFCTSLAFLFCSWSRGCQFFSRLTILIETFAMFIPKDFGCCNRSPQNLSGSVEGGLFRFVPICSSFFQFLPICFQNKSGEPPFCRPLSQIPDVIEPAILNK